MTKLLNSSLALVFGGEDGAGHIFNDMYSLHIERSEWRRIKYAPGPCPPPRLLHTSTAISSTVIVVLFGDVATGPIVDKESTVPSNDAWIFDLKNNTWREAKDNGPNRPPPLSCHSAVLGSGPGMQPAIYVFGGLSKGLVGSAVHRLKIGDWKWECLPFYVKNGKGQDVLVNRPRNENGEFQPEPGGPGRRECHAAIWVPNLNGMLIVGGDGGVELFGDCWLFTPAQTHRVWRWKHLRMTISRGLPQNRLPKCAGHSLLTFPSDGTQVLLWGGLRWPESENQGADKTCYIIDLDALQTTVVKIPDTTPTAGRLLHGIVRLNKQLVMFGGCDENGIALSGTEKGRLVQVGSVGGRAALDFGPEASSLAVRGSAAFPREKKEGELENINDEEDEENEEYLPLVGPSSIPPGTPLSGRIIDVTDFGYFVSVVINGKLYKGVLVANPLKGVQSLAETNIPPVERDNAKAPETKRLRVDPIADLLPDPDEVMRKPNRKPAQEIIDLD